MEFTYQHTHVIKSIGNIEGITKETLMNSMNDKVWNKVRTQTSVFVLFPLSTQTIAELIHAAL